ncbi:arsenate reductase family protein [Eremococcus coleocola]|uniref:arsenate reductase family protein n=1 Tax=Eremococcus coleocola TaxID=88132 RepID=UPI0004286FA5|nr:arsenate reductase family protein [Eremococcus coleocola]
MQFIHLPQCSTCKRAEKWLLENNIGFESRHILEDTPRPEELKEWYLVSGLPIKRFFNTSGNKYKELGLKDKLDTLSLDQQIELLASDGMLIKRPILVEKDQILIGFKVDQWQANFDK